MVQLIQDVLNYSRLSRTNATTEDVDLQRLMDQIVVDFELAIKEKNATITYENLPTLTANTLHMRQLFSNLVSNALKFSRPDVPPQILIKSRPLLQEEKENCPALLPAISYCVVSVQDNGIGLDQEYADKIFGIFQRLHTKTEFEGTGIGLALCKKIAHNYHGELWVESEKGAGSTFYVILPTGILPF
jgi:light-regulated signal transduction histidine kinase (bacteriophytochrome)